MAHTLYRFYSITGQLLYIGITMNAPARFNQHKAEKSWWHEVAGISMEVHETRSDVEKAERRAIKVERPLHNIAHRAHPSKTDRARSPIIPTPKPPDPAIITYNCDACQTPIADNSGYIHVSMEEVDAYPEAISAWESAHTIHGVQGSLGPVISGLGLFSMPSPARWCTHHHSCDPYPEIDCYWFGVERARTHEELLSWTGHLLGKGWIQNTDWDDFIRGYISPRAHAV
ncbi:GIY-YIG nuclease family protein [Mycobacterium marinum]|uniref:GIY-YIG nuclease family protein n=1 Tax=Mycobacterium marinum TaxID=1781 RepID=UPI000B960609|nr:GIY-YIG nuclease family protein [Mycobacterium marinum]